MDRGWFPKRYIHGSSVSSREVIPGNFPGFPGDFHFPNPEKFLSGSREIFILFEGFQW